MIPNSMPRIVHLATGIWLTVTTMNVAMADAVFPPPAGIVNQIPFSGEIIPADYMKSGLHWSLDGERIMFLIKTGTTGKNDSANRPLFTYVCYVADLTSGKIEQRFSASGNGKVYWLAGNRILEDRGQRLWLHQPDGSAREVTADYARAWDVTVSPDGSCAVFHGQRPTNPPEAQVQFPLLVLDVATGTVREIAIPSRQAPKTMAEASLNCWVESWLEPGQLGFITEWCHRRMSSYRIVDATWRYSLKTNTLESLIRPEAMRLGEPLTDMKPDILKEKYSTCDYFLPNGQRLRRRLAEGSFSQEIQHYQDTGNDMEPEQIRMRAGIAERLEVLTAADKPVKQIKIDPEITGHGDLWPYLSSDDSRMVLAVVYREMQQQLPAGGSAYWEPVPEGVVLIDLDQGKCETGIKLDVSPRRALINLWAVMSQRQELLSLYIQQDPQHGIWRIPFSGQPENLAPRLGLPETWSANTPIVPGDADNPRLQRWHDRLALVTRPQAVLKCEGPRLLLAFVNAATPDVIWRSTGFADQPDHIAWSPQGDRLAFVTAGNIMVWKAPAITGTKFVFQSGTGDDKDSAF